MRGEGDGKTSELLRPNSKRKPQRNVEQDCEVDDFLFLNRNYN